MSCRPAAAQRLRDLAWLRPVRARITRIDRGYGPPPDVEALARGAYTLAWHLSHKPWPAYGEWPYDCLIAQRGEPGDETGQESRSAGHRGATSVTTMNITAHQTFLPDHGQDDVG